MSKEKKVNVTANVPKDLYQKFKEVVKEEGYFGYHVLNQIMEQGMTVYIKEHKENGKSK